MLLANIAGMYAVYHGPQGLRRIAERVHRLADILALGLQQRGDAAQPLLVRHPDSGGARQGAVLARALGFGINLRGDLDGAVGISFDECSTRDDLEALFTILLGDGHALDIDTTDTLVQEACEGSIPAALLRREPILTHPVFNRYHSETALMRYMHALERRDLALNQAMIPLGSCTMKLNAAAEMIPITA